MSDGQYRTVGERIYHWFADPIPARPVTVWREMVPLGVGVILLALLAPSAEWQARLATAGFGLMSASISVLRPKTIWNHVCRRGWGADQLDHEGDFSDRIIWLIYIAIGITAIVLAIIVPIDTTPL